MVIISKYVEIMQYLVTNIDFVVIITTGKQKRFPV